MDNIKEITYLGKTVRTKNFIEVSDEERNFLKSEYFKKPDKEIMLKQMKTISNGGVMNDKITRYYFKDLMAHTQVETAKWTVEDVFNSNELLGMFKAKTFTNKKVFPDEVPLVKNIETAI